MPEGYLDLRMTACVEARLKEVSHFLWPGIFAALSQTLEGRAPVYTIKGAESRFSVSFGLEKDELDVAARKSENLVEQALDCIGLGWLAIECVGVAANEVIDQDIARINEDGSTRPEADIIPITRPKS